MPGFVSAGTFGAGSGLNTAFGITTRSNGDVVVVAQDQSRYYVFDAVGAFLYTVAVPCTNQMWSVDADPSDNLYITCRFDDLTVKFDAADNLAGSVTVAEPRGVTWLPSYP